LPITEYNSKEEPHLKITIVEKFKSQTEDERRKNVTEALIKLENKQIGIGGLKINRLLSQKTS